MREKLSSEISPHTIATAQWWQDRASAFEGLDKSLYLEEIIEELEGIEQRKYLRIQGSTDLSRAQFENWATEIGLVLNPPPDVEPFQHCCYKFRKDQEENNEDYRRRPRGKEVVLTWIVKNDEEIKKENPADLVKWSKARREAEVVINRDDSIDSRTVDLRQVHFDKAVEIATKHGVSSQFLLNLKQVKNELESTRTICAVPNAGQAAAAFCSRRAQRARLEAEATEAPADNHEEKGQTDTVKKSKKSPAKKQARGSPQSSGAGAATWDTIEMSFVSDERVQIYNGTDKKTYNYSELGFVDSRNGKPNQAWLTLCDLAEARGIILIDARRDLPWPKVEKRVQEIRKTLRDHLGISSDPFLFKDGIGYQALFKIVLSPSFHGSPGPFDLLS